MMNREEDAWSNIMDSRYLEQIIGIFLLQFMIIGHVTIKELKIQIPGEQVYKQGARIGNIFPFPAKKGI